MTQFHSLTVAQLRRETSDAVCVSLEVPTEQDATFAFTPGQYLTFEHTIDGETVRRPYSICSSPSAHCLQVGIKAVEGGKFSQFANTSLAVGDTLEVMPPEGRFRVSLDPAHRKHYLLLAAGSGITPILSIATSVLESEADSRVTLIYGNRDTASVMFRDTLDDLKNRYLDRLRITWLMSREPQDVALHAGRLDSAKLDELFAAGLLSAEHIDEVFLCGPGDFIDGLETALHARGIDDSRIHHERFSTGDAPAILRKPKAEQASTGCQVTVHLDGASRVFGFERTDNSLIDAARRAGIDLPWSCKGGMCCTCRCKKVQGDAEMRANFSLEAWEMDAGYVLACQLEPHSNTLELDFDAS
ncbi:MAG: 1,2-phenylacetyl-CoA epoxidase subunit PaaE [Pseudomonadota bacterium]